MSDERVLTSGEIDLVRTIFGDAIDCGRVRLVKRKWWPFQPKNAAMAPCGNIHFHPHGTLWSQDFSREPLWLQGFWIHEMTHVWQAQRYGRFYLPLMRQPFSRYRYEIVPGRSFARYGLEQQAEIVRQTFLLRRGYRLVDAPPLEELEKLLPFSRPSSPRRPEPVSAAVP